MKFISCDQSTTHCALTFWNDGVPVDKVMIRTGSTHSKVQTKGVTHFPIITQQIDFICNEICCHINSFQAKAFVYEGLSMGSFGDAKSTLGTLFRAIKETIQEKTNLTEQVIFSYAPTSVKSFARKSLPLEQQREIKTKKTKNKKTGEIKETTKEGLCEMTKARMVEACVLVAPVGWLDNLTLADGKADYADSFFIGMLYINNGGKK